VSNFENIARQIALDAPMVLGETIVLIAGGIDISVGAVMAMSAALAIGLQPYGTPVAVSAALAFGALVGLVNGLLVTRGKIVAFVATLGTMSVVTGMVLTYTKQRPLVGVDDNFAWWGGGTIGPVPVPLIIVLVLLLLLWIMLTHTRAGRRLYAIGGDSDAAFLGGLSIERGLMSAYVLAGLLSGIAGVLVASRLNSASSQLGGDAPLTAIAAAMIGGASLLGGRGSIVAAFVGVLALGVLSNGMDLLGVPTYTQIAIHAAILVAVVAIDALANGLRRRGAASLRTPE
jgi:ribose/xylose/arabinose/galactoside ABC-type transport system permease subunit